jgi:hypothetical protein
MNAARALLPVVVLPLIASAPEPIPIKVRLNLPLIAASVNGSGPLTFVIDSGAARICLDQKTAAGLGLQPVRRITSSGAGGPASTDVMAGAPIRIGGREFVPDEICSLDLSDFSHPFDVPIHGILGKPFFMRYAVEIDYARADVRLYEPGAYAGPGKMLPIRIGASPVAQGTIQMVVGGDPIAARLEVDTGSQGLLILAEPFIRKHNLLESVREWKTEQGHGVGGDADFMTANIASVNLGGFIVENPQTRFARTGKGIFAQDDRDGSLGGEFLRRFRVIFDYRNSRLILDPAQ